MAELVFVGVPAFVGRVDKKSQCAFWSEDASKFTFDPNRMISVDLAKNTAAVAPASWDEVQVDADPSKHGLSSVGPQFNNGMYIGAVYLTQKVFEDNKAKMDWPPHPNHADYQYTSVARTDGTGKILRWSGFKAEVLDAKAPLVKVKIYETGDLVGSGPFWIDLSDPAVCDPTYTKIKATSPIGTQDALFLTWSYANLLGTNIPKLPPGAGLTRFPGLEVLSSPQQATNLATLLTARANVYGR